MFVMKSVAGGEQEEAGAAVGASTAVKVAGLFGYFAALRFAFAAVQYATYAAGDNN